MKEITNQRRLNIKLVDYFDKLFRIKNSPRLKVLMIALTLVILSCKKTDMKEPIEVDIDKADKIEYAFMNVICKSSNTSYFSIAVIEKFDYLKNNVRIKSIVNGSVFTFPKENGSIVLQAVNETAEKIKNKDSILSNHKTIISLFENRLKNVAGYKKKYSMNEQQVDLFMNKSIVTLAANENARVTETENFWGQVLTGTGGILTTIQGLSTVSYAGITLAELAGAGTLGEMLGFAFGPAALALGSGVLLGGVLTDQAFNHWIRDNWNKFNDDPNYTYDDWLLDIRDYLDDLVDDLQPDPNNDSTQTAESWGDPHLITFDGLKYDFQAWGEFVGVKSTTDNFEVQVRYIGTTGGAFSFNAGVAVQTGNDIISSTERGLYINGLKQSNNSTTINLKGGGSVYYENSNIKIVSKWGDVVRIYGSRPVINLHKNRKGKVVGLFGNYDGNPKNDLLINDNKSIDISDLPVDNFSLRLPYDRIYPILPNVWRISQSSSLFHYQSGETTETFTVRDFPKVIPTFSDERIQWARKVCSDGGVNKEPFISACTYDVALTGSLKWIEESLISQNQSKRTDIIKLNTYSNISYFPKMRVTISKDQGVLEDSCLVDYANGRVFQLKDGVKYAQYIDGIFLTYCSISLYTPQTIITCDFSCGTGRTNSVITNPKWSYYRKGQIDGGRNVDPSKFDEISSSSEIESIATGLNANNTFNFANIVQTNGVCVPTTLLEKTLKIFITNDGKRGLMRIRNWGEKDGKYWIEFDIKIQK